MRSFLFSILAIATLTFTACEKDRMSVNSADEELILAIQNATDKSAVASSTLPATASTVLNSDYTESTTEEVLLASDLGYEVQLRRTEGTRVGERNTIYFNLDGQPLGYSREDGKKRDRKDCKGKDLRECFDFVYPVTFTLPDGTTTSGDKETLHTQIKEWYEANPDAEERPSLQFPVEITFEDGTIQTINSDEELEAAKESCEN